MSRKTVPGRLGADKGKSMMGVGKGPGRGEAAGPGESKNSCEEDGGREVDEAVGTGGWARSWWVETTERMRS